MSFLLAGLASPPVPEPTQPEEMIEHGSTWFLMGSQWVNARHVAAFHWLPAAINESGHETGMRAEAVLSGGSGCIELVCDTLDKRVLLLCAFKAAAGIKDE